MKRLLLVTHRPLPQEGGPTARWRAFVRHLPAHGWEVDVVSAPLRASGVEFVSDERSARRVVARARLMGSLGRVAEPVFRLAGLRPEAVPLSMLWVVNGTRAVRARLREARPDVVLATAPPAVAMFVATGALPKDGPPLVLELRDLWAGNPFYETRPGALDRLERKVVTRAARVVVMTPEAASDVESRHPDAAARVVAIPNGFEPALLERRGPERRSGEPLTLLHSGTLVGTRPLAPLLSVLARDAYRGRVKLVLHGYLSPASREEVDAARSLVELEIVPPSSWEDAVERMCRADVCLVTQSDAVGDQTAVASKVFEYLALGKPVLATTDGGATEALLRRLEVDALVARLDDASSIAAALDRALDGEWPEPVPPAELRPYDRRLLAGEMARLLNDVVREGASVARL
jgi:glycosyltransferase involved in cell wall biosynthesis